MRCRTLLVVISICAPSSRGVQAFSSRIPPYLVRLPSARQRSSPPLHASTTAVSDDNDEPIRYNWTRPTLDIAVPALIGMMAGMRHNMSCCCDYTLTYAQLYFHRSTLESHGYGLCRSYWIIGISFAWSMYIYFPSCF